jgi:RNA polymerase sigma factor (sigma-70 family)
MPAPPHDGRSITGAATNAWPSTIWELVRRSREGPADQRRGALDDLFRQYYKPVHRFFQKALRVDERNLDDLTQEFFTRFLEKDFLKNLEQEKSFRGFLKIACRRHFINWVEARQAAKRSGDRTVPMDFEPVAEDRIDGMIDEELRTWYLEESVDRTKAALTAEGHESYFRIFEARAGLRGGDPPDYQALAAEFGIPVYDVSNRLMAARKRFRQALLDLAAERSPDPMEEMRELGLSRYFI